MSGCSGGLLSPDLLTEPARSRLQPSSASAAIEQNLKGEISMSAYRAALCEDEAAERRQIAEILAAQGVEAAG